MVLKAIILLGGPEKGTRFRPLSLNVPKPLFPIAGVPMVKHHIDACSKVPEIAEIILIGFYQPSDALNRFIRKQRKEIDKPICYLQEYSMLGTAGCLYHFRDIITTGSPDAFFVLFSDVFCDFPLQEMMQFKEKYMQCVIMSAEIPSKQTMNYGCLGINKTTNEVVHYVEKPETFVSKDINGGLYLFSPDIFRDLRDFYRHSLKHFDLDDHDATHCPPRLIRRESSMDITRPYFAQQDSISLERDVLPLLAGKGKIFAYRTEKFWMSIKSAGSALYANAAILDSYLKSHNYRLSKSVNCIGNVFVDPTAEVDPTAVLGPHVSIGAGVVIGRGVRVRNAMILEGTTLNDHSCILNSIIGWHCVIGEWARVEGTPTELDPNAPHATTDNFYLFDDSGKLRPSITILGHDVTVPAEIVVRNAIVMPNKSMSRGFKNQILL